jgi:hypothetical protein
LAEADLLDIDRRPGKSVFTINRCGVGYRRDDAPAAA